MRDSITVNIRPEQRQQLGALAHVRRTTMHDIALDACHAYLETPVQHIGGMLRDPNATWRFSMRIPPDLQQRLEDRAAREIGAPRTPLGAPGRKTYKAAVIRRAISRALDQMTSEETARVGLYLEATAA